MYAAVPTKEHAEEEAGQNLLPSNNDDKSMEEEIPDVPRWKRRLYRLNSVIVLLNVAFFIWALILFIESGHLKSRADEHLEWARQQNRHFDEHCTERTTTFSPATEAIKYKTVQFEGTFDRESIYKGTPRPELDKAWTALIHEGDFEIDEGTMHRINKTENLDYVGRFPEASGGAIVAGLEMFHQMHCVNFLRQYTYKEYYEEEIKAFTDGEGLLRLHLVVMCFGDTTLLTGQWVEGYPRLVPDFNTQHKCRDYNSLIEWNVRKADKKESYRDIKKPIGVRERPKPGWVEMQD